MRTATIASRSCRSASTRSTRPRTARCSASSPTSLSSLGTATTANVTLGAITLEEIQVLGTRIVTAVDVKSTESATNVTREELERLPVERDILVGRAARAGPEQGRRGLCWAATAACRSAAPRSPRTRVYINGLNVTDFYNRVGFSTRAVCVLQGIPGQDRRLLGRVRPHHRRRHQRRDALRHERIRVRHRSGLGAELRCRSSKRRPLRPRRQRRTSSAATTSTTAPPRPCTRPARSSRTSCSSSRCTRRATISRVNTDDEADTFFDAQGGQRLLGREDRLADQRQAPAGAAGVLRRERGSDATASTSTSPPATRGAFVEHASSPTAAA